LKAGKSDLLVLYLMSECSQRALFMLEAGAQEDATIRHSVKKLHENGFGGGLGLVFALFIYSTAYRS
jgi:hypothetical protein